MTGVPVLMRGDGVGGAASRGDTRKVAGACASAFLDELLSSMQKTVPEGGIGTGGRGEEIFRGTFNQVLAEDLASDLDLGGWLLRGLGVDLKKLQETDDESSGGTAASLNLPVNPGVEGSLRGRLEATG